MSYDIDSKESLESFITNNWNKVNQYIDEQSKNLPIPFYTSVDIRESKDKFAPVDNNIYPAGFNNLCQLDLDASGKQFRETINTFGNDIEKIGIIPESNTKNLFYLDHLAFLSKALMDEGYEVTFLSFDENLFETSNEVILLSQSKFEIKIHKAVINDNILFAGETQLDFAILNNDQSNPIKIDWKTIKTPIAPSPSLGWFKRQKNEHFQEYKTVANQFAEEFSIDPCLLQALFLTREGIDFSTKEGLEELGNTVDELLAKIKTSEDDHRKVFVKASQGTYGMGISVVSSGEEIVSMNRKNRDKMNIGKNKIKFTSLLVQEGVDSILRYDDMAAEITIYLAGGKPIGGFVRANESRAANENLNSRGMVFRKYCISEIREKNDFQSKEAVYSIIARLSTVAAAKESIKLNQ
ncbi:glutamate--cysteine ligase [Bacteriovoracaceae bacterium]|nr:glutamate--cysteine ligase [Bacteriovoracaceae bacterium]